MPLGLSTYVFLHYLLFASAGVAAAGVLGWTLRNREKQAAGLFAGYMALICVWLVTAVAEFALATPLLVDVVLEFTGGVVRAWMSLVFLLFCLEYTGTIGDVPRVVWGIIVAAFTTTMLSSIGFPTLFVEYGLNPTTEPFTTVYYEHALAWPGHLIAPYAFVAGGALILCRSLARTGYSNYEQVAVGVLATLPPILTDIAIPNVSWLVIGVDYSVTATVVSSLLFTTAIYRYDLFSYTPIARDHAVEAMTDGVVVLNPDRRVVDYNDAAREVATATIKEGVSAREVLPTALVETPSVVEADSGHESVTATVDGTERSFEVDVDVLWNVNDLAAIVLVIRDVTEIERYATELEQQTSQLEQVAELVAHDLRNPLTVAKSYTEFADEEAELEEHDRVIDALDRMDEIIDDTLTLARQGRHVGDLRWCSLTDAATQAWENTHTAAGTLKVDGDTELRADAARLRTALENLFRNSVDHGPADVAVTVGALPDGFYVADDGPGIPESSRERVTEQGFSTNDDGTGFGLAIVDSIAEAHGWSLTVTESASGGARFEFTGVETP